MYHTVIKWWRIEIELKYPYVCYKWYRGKLKFHGFYKGHRRTYILKRFRYSNYSIDFNSPNAYLAYDFKTLTAIWRNLRFLRLKIFACIWRHDTYCFLNVLTSWSKNIQSALVCRCCWNKFIFKFGTMSCFARGAQITPPPLIFDGNGSPTPRALS